MKTYYLANGVNLSVTSGTAIFLDLRKGQYFGLSRSQTECLCNLLPALRTCTPCRTPSPSTSDDENAGELALALERRGLLTTEAANGQPIIPVNVRVTEAHLLDEAFDADPRIGLHDVWTFVRASIAVKLALHLFAFEKLVDRVAKRKRLSKRRIDDLGRIRELLRAFRALRPWFHTHKDKCLYDSLVLVEFLACNDVFPVWVIGVKSDPFGAHAWVQHAQYVLSGSFEAVNDYSPIVAV